MQEARGEPPDGQRAVAHVIRNRMKDGRWGSSLASVCLWPKQFSGWNPKDPNFDYARKLSDTDPLIIKMLKALNDSAVLQDITNGANHYHATWMKEPPAWAAAMTHLVTIGQHKFFTDKPKPSGTGQTAGV